MKKNKKKIVILMILLLGFLFAYLTTKLWAEKQTIYQSLQTFSKILDIVLREYVEEVNSEDLIKNAIDGMLNSLDPYTQYLTEEEFKDLKIRTEAQFGGIGIQIGIQDGQLTVISPIEGTPAYRAGIIAGDKIVKINDVSTEGISLEEAVKKLRGEPGTKVKVTIKREGIEEELNFTLTREIIKIHAIPFAGKLTEDIGYIRLADFSSLAEEELKNTLDSLFGKEKIKKLILDLRSNSGGLLQEGVEIGSTFLEKGNIVVKVRGRYPENERIFYVEKETKYKNYPLIVLVDRGSASATEIVAGALQDYERALIIGETTFGKGSVQNIRPLDENTALKITTAYWYTPAGRCIHKKVKKDSLKEKEFKKTYKTLGKLGREIYGGGGIAPDIFLPYQTLSKFMTKLRQENIFFKFAVKYYAQHKTLKTPPPITKEFIYNEFVPYLKEKNIKFSEEDISKDEEEIKRELAIEIAEKIGGLKARYETLLRFDPHVKKAIELLKKVNSQEELFKIALR
uniref:S41 family peptidase n=1 Tax=candidate division WOR-3 bacterium TaxID=2052148 RepID=A0A7V3ZWE2_UNCW3